MSLELLKITLSSTKCTPLCYFGTLRIQKNAELTFSITNTIYLLMLTTCDKAPEIIRS